MKRKILFVLFGCFFILLAGLGGCNSCEAEKFTTTGGGGGTEDGGDGSDGDGGSGSISELPEGIAISGTLDGEGVEFTQALLTISVNFTEYNSPNGVYDADDVSFGVGFYTANFWSGSNDGIYLSAGILTYTDFEANVIYEFTDPSSFTGNVSLKEGGITSSYSATSLSILFTSVPASAGQNVAGRLQLQFDGSESVTAEFSGVLIRGIINI